MMYEISVLKSDEGLVLASCPELGLSCVGDSEDAALDELQSWSFFHTVVMPTGMMDVIQGKALSAETSNEKKVLYIPPSTQLN